LKRKHDIGFVVAQDSSGKASLSVFCTSKGFYLALQCPDGFSCATSQVFPWHEITHVVYWINPDMFGILHERLHFIFPQTMELLGYEVPSWRIEEVRQMLGYCWLDKGHNEELFQQTVKEREIEKLLQSIVDEEDQRNRDNQN